MKNLILENDGATEKLGQKISEIIKSSDKQNIEIHLQGDLGAGKTFITRSIIKNCRQEIPTGSSSLVYLARPLYLQGD